MQDARTTLIVVGACAIDTILTVPYFPEIDSKLRATSLKRRRGGNGPNTLEVLRQLLQEDNRVSTNSDTTREIDLKLVAVLPKRESSQISLISSSFKDANTTAWGTSSLQTPQTPCLNDHLYDIDLSHCIYREEASEPVSSFIIADEETGSRTIVNHNDLLEMRFDEFKAIADNILADTKCNVDEHQEPRHFWFHFEGRIPDVSLECMQYLRDHPVFSGNDSLNGILKLSVEVEKPKRAGLHELAELADVIFYSKNWALGEGYVDAQQTLIAQARSLNTNVNASSVTDRILTCTWGDKGAWALQLPCNDEKFTKSVVFSPAYTVQNQSVVDTVGAGDTFNAGIFYALLCRDGEKSSRQWTLQQKIAFANFLAGKKVVQQGFASLARQVSELLKD